MSKKSDLLAFAEGQRSSKSGNINRLMRKKQDADAAALKQTSLKRQSLLLSEIGEDEAISDLTRRELTSGFGEKGSLLSAEQEKGLRSTFSAAREGKEAKFKQRQKSQARSELLADRPGRSQTILTR